MAKILVVDDEPDLRFLLRRLFEGNGHQVAEAGNGHEALEAVRESPPDVVVTDLMMPVMDGTELIRRLRADPATSEIPIAVVTGHSMREPVADVVVILKPYELAPLKTAVLDLLARKANPA